MSVKQWEKAARAALDVVHQWEFGVSGGTYYPKKKVEDVAQSIAAHAPDEAAIRTQAEQYRPYMQHLPSCNLRNTPSTKRKVFRCTCGLDAVLNAM